MKKYGFSENVEGCLAFMERMKVCGILSKDPRSLSMISTLQVPQERY